jgi:OOP family OmpA-OmpF porin
VSAHPQPSSEDAAGLPGAGHGDYLDEGLVKAMTPVTERTIRRSVELNPRILAEALFPIIGAAVRKSIAQAFDRMIQSLNSAVENSFSPESIRWRIEAKRTGKSFAEVVVLRTLLYRVEQVFLIEKSSGLLLQHAAVDAKLAQNRELVSAMLTAVQDFVRDSFQTGDNEGIGSATIGDVTLWIETGPQAVVAGVIRGNPPQELRDVLHDTLVAIHQDHLKPLASFRGEMDEFASTRELLEGCLRQQRLAPKPEAPKEKKKWRPTPFHFIAGAALLAFGVWAGFAWRDASRWQAFQEYLADVPGIVIYKTEKRGGKYHLEGLVDPLAENPLAALPEFKIPEEKVLARWTPFQSLDERIVQRRTRQQADALREKIEATALAAAVGPEAQVQLARMASDFEMLDRMTQESSQRWLLQVVGNAADTEAATMFLQRAGVPAERLATPRDDPESGQAADGRVRFRVIRAAKP